MSDKVPGAPVGFSHVTPYIVLKGAAKALIFYQEAFGATEVLKLPGPDGRLMHAEMKIGESIIMLVDAFPEYDAQSTGDQGGSGLHLYVPDVDVAYERAIKAGATSIMPPADAFWGDRFSKLRDPFGLSWSLATHLRDLSPEELAEAAKKAFSGG